MSAKEFVLELDWWNYGGDTCQKFWEALLYKIRMLANKGVTLPYTLKKANFVHNRRTL